MNTEVSPITLPADARRHWRRIQSVLPTGVAQLILQAIGFATGLLVIRLLPLQEYAYYTVVNAALGTMTLLSDSGISQSMLAEGGKAWEDPRSLGGVVAAGLLLRRRFALAALIVTMPVMFLMLRRQGAAGGTALLLVASIVPLFITSLTTQILQIVPRLHQRVLPMQYILMSSAGLRLALTAAGLLVGPVAWMANICAGLAQAWCNVRMRLLSGGLADLRTPPDPAASAAIWKLVRRSLPNAVYYAFEGQLTIWLIALFGKVQAIAQVGALNRLSVAFNVFSGVLSIIWLPRLARLRPGIQVLRQFWLLQICLVALLATVVAAVAAFPRIVLAVLGSAYESLTQEIVLSAAAGALGLLAGSTYYAAAARGVVITPWFVIPFAICLQCTLIIVLPVSTVSGLLWLSIINNLAFWGCHAFNFLIRLRVDETQRFQG
jgi:O-antigen/teichoic acid export membrane protein